MVWKKSFINIVIYVLYFLGIGSALSSYVYIGAVDSGQSKIWSLAVVFGFIVGILMLFLLFRFVAKRLSSAMLSHNGEWAGIAEGVLFIAFMTAGLALRIVNLDLAGENIPYFEIAKVTGDSGIMEVTHGATYFYIYLLRTLFLVVGNKWIGGIWLQMILQILASVLLYVSVKKLVGAAAGLTVLGMIMFLPTETTRGLTYTPHVFFLVLYAVALLGVAFFLKQQSCESKNTWREGCLIVFPAVLVGLVCYLDVTGLTLLVPVLFGFTAKNAEASWKKRTVRILLLIFLSVFIWFVCLGLDAYACNKGFLDILYAWIEIHKVKAQDLWFWYMGKGELTGFFVVCLMMFGSFAFWLRGKEQRYLPWIVMLFGVCVMEYFQIPVTHMDGEMLLLVLGGILSGVGIQECICKENKHKITQKEFGGLVPEKGEGSNEVSKTISEGTPAKEDAKPNVKLIENPLPLPKKHVKKELNYKVEPVEEAMHYDVEISENDDFDL